MIAAQQDRKSALESLFSTMLHLLMTGQVRVNDWDIAPNPRKEVRKWRVGLFALGNTHSSKTQRCTLSGGN